MSKWQRIALGVAAFFAWVALEGVSIAANMKFAWSIGSTDLERYILVAGSIASDLLKAIIPVAILYFFAIRKWTALGASVALGSVAIAFSVMAATGFMAGERWREYYTSVAKMTDTKDTRAEIAKEKSDRAWLPTHKPLAVLEAEKRSSQADSRWRISKGCTTARGEIEEWCREVRQLDVAIAAAEEAGKADKRIEQKLNKLATEGRDYGDAQVEAVASITGADQKTVLIALTILGVLLIELGSTLGLTVSMALFAPLIKEGSRVGDIVGKALTIVPGGKAAPKYSIATEQASAPKPPKPEAIQKAVGSGSGSFKQPAAIKPDAGGLRSKIKARAKLAPANAA